MPDTWEAISSMIQMVVLPLLGWALFSIVNHGKQIILLEEKVNDALNRRMTSIEDKVGSLETKIDNKIDAVEESIVDCKLTIHDKLNEKFDTLISKLEK
tara:strand:+ start:3340 stop:3636 length:297 start_codon:yes stop_codon:yes gene_type:complete